MIKFRYFTFESLENSPQSNLIYSSRCYYLEETLILSKICFLYLHFVIAIVIGVMIFLTNAIKMFSSESYAIDSPTNQSI